MTFIAAYLTGILIAKFYHDYRKYKRWQNWLNLPETKRSLDRIYFILEDLFPTKHSTP